jgi:hypothetical protein
MCEFIETLEINARTFNNKFFGNLTGFKINRNVDPLMAANPATNPPKQACYDD